MPKGVQLTHANLMVFSKTGSLMTEIIKMTYNVPMTSMIIGPWSHGAGFFNVFLISCSMEAKMVMTDRFIHDLFLSCIEVGNLFRSKQQFLTIFLFAEV